MLLKPWLTVLIYLGFAAFGWLVFRVIVRRDYRNLGKLSASSTWLEVSVFFVHGVISYLYVEWDFPWLPPLGARPVLNVIAFVLMIGGLVGVLTSMTGLGYGATMGQGGGGIRRTGIYGITRNPQIILYAVLILGYSLLWPNWLAAVWVLVYIFVAHMMVITEEEFLFVSYGEEYADYCREVPRYLLNRNNPNGETP